MLDSNFKEQLYEFIEFVSEPWDIDFLIRNCRQWVDRWRFYDVLYELETEGRVIRLKDGRYLSIRVLRRKWIKTRLVDLPLPKSLFEKMKYLIHMGVYESIEELIREAIRNFKKA